ncbi:MAG: hypothetical protein K2Q03_01390 [Sphingobacteriaceae bacterium]|nr:hypothetical protein [Sphingobacteriaceae bacterium]
MKLQSKVILGSLITGVYDVNRNETLQEDDFKLVNEWVNSIKNAGLQAVLFHNSFSVATQQKFENDNLIFIKVENSEKYNPNVFRYFLYLDFLKKYYSQITDVFVTDVSDVVLVNNPFEDLFYIQNSNFIFCGDEPEILNNVWMNAHSTHLRNQISDFESYEQLNENQILLNCGIIGGKYMLMLSFFEQLCKIHQTYNQHNNTAYTGDMGAFNYVLRTQFNQQFIHGKPVNTVFKEYETERKDCWFRHK